MLVNKTEIEFGKFPNGDLYLKTDMNNVINLNDLNFIETNKFTIYTKLYTSDNIMELLLFMDAYENYCTYIGRKIPIDLHLLYCPYMQADKYIVEQSNAVSILVIGKILKTLNIEKIYIYGAHSKKINDVLDATFLYPIFPLNMIFNNLEDHKNVAICAPDKGATERASFYCLHLEKKYIQANKVRDIKTGNLLSFELENVDINGYNVIIYDDVTVNGGTFVGVAKKLLSAGAKNVYLCVTHVVNKCHLDYITKVFYINLVNPKPVIPIDRKFITEQIIDSQYVQVHYRNLNYFKL